MAMGLVLITLGLPAFLLVGSLDLLGNLYEACGGDRKDWTLFVVGADKPDDVPEQCNREAAGKMEAVRGKGPWPNFVYHLRNNHPVFGVFCCEHGHPFSPVERMGLLVLLLSFAYFMAGLKVKFVDYTKHAHWHDELDWLWIDCYSLVCITLPSMVLQTMLKFFALLNYKYVLNKYSYFAKMRDQRCRSFARQFCVDRGLGIERPRTRRQQGTGFGDCDCLEKCCTLFCKLSDACKACNNSCEDGKAQAVNSLFASLFAGLAFAGSCVFVVLGIWLDMDASEDVWQSVSIGAGQRFRLLGQEVPPHPELWLEMRQFFRLLDRNNDGLISGSVPCWCRFMRHLQGLAFLGVWGRSFGGRASHLLPRMNGRNLFASMIQYRILVMTTLATVTTITTTTVNSHHYNHYYHSRRHPHHHHSNVQA
ncbi:unnamed protein product [Symbiodinium sp. CCMP2592]|nr:unnamed protein product [Symbiodinium sp. CCMP2592]